MAVTAADLLAPAGRLDPAVLWPTESLADVQSRIAAYLTDAVLRTASFAAADIDAAVTAWVYYRAYDAVYQRIISTPASATLAEQGSYAILPGQLAAIATERDSWRATFDALAPSSAVVRIGPQSAAAITRPTW